ncbi:MAG: class F sortase [Ornithinimicrobium sp.]
MSGSGDLPQPSLASTSPAAGVQRTDVTSSRIPVQASSTPEAAVNTPTSGAPPTTVSIPAIGVSSVIDPMGLNADGSLEVPARGPSYDHAGWFTGSPPPGDSGPAVLLGHVNGRGGAPSVFSRLSELDVGDTVSVSRSDGSTTTFEIYRAEQYPKDAFPTTAVYGDTAGSELRLITCAGAWDAEVHHYQDNTVVYARLLPPPLRPLMPAI